MNDNINIVMLYKDWIKMRFAIMKIKNVIAFILSMCIVSGTAGVSDRCNAEGAVYKEVTFPSIDVNDGEVIKGVDISSIISLEKSGVVFRNEKGEKQDIFLTLKNAGVNYIRVRVWNEPYNSSGATYGGGANDIDTAVKIAQRCAEYGLKLLVDFHYSDFWADPGKQYCPKSWKGYDLTKKSEAIKEFTSSSLSKISATGVQIGMVQIGNETTSGMCGEYDWNNVCSLMNSASSVIRKFDNDILIALHFTNPEKTEQIYSLASKVSRVDYDVFATSYYPYWHGTLSNLTEVLKNISQKYDKYVMVAETSWANSFEDTDMHSNTISETGQLGNYVSYDVSVQGQINSVSDVFKAVADAGQKGIGVFYWEPAWITVGNDYNSNMQIWEKHGSGWASKAAGEYQEDAAKYHGGSAVDNQALFDKEGNPLDSLYLFSHITSEKKSLKENLLKNPGFESDKTDTSSPVLWKITDTTSGEYSKFTINSEMVRNGEYSLHWYSADSFENSSALTEITAECDGNYKFSSYFAGEKSTCKIRIYVNNVLKDENTCKPVAYNSWDKLSVMAYAKKGDVIKAEISVTGDKEGYGSADDCFMEVDENVSDKKQPGDINNDNKIDIADLVCFKEYLFGIKNVSGDYSIYDIDEDGKVDIKDFVLFKNFLLLSLM